MSKDYYKDFIIPLFEGDFDVYLDGMIDSIKLRKADIAPKIWEYKVGETVKIVNCRPRYLNGYLATVVKVNRTKVVIRLKESASDRFTKWTPITTPLTAIEKISPEPLDSLPAPD